MTLLRSGKCCRIEQSFPNWLFWHFFSEVLDEAKASRTVLFNTICTMKFWVIMRKKRKRQINSTDCSCWHSSEVAGTAWLCCRCLQTSWCSLLRSQFMTSSNVTWQGRNKYNASFNSMLLLIFINVTSVYCSVLLLEYTINLISIIMENYICVFY